MPGNQAPASRAARRRASSLRERIRFLRSKPSEDLHVDPKILDKFDEELTYLERFLSEIEPDLTRGRHASLATRFATHFFVEKSMSRFCERILDELIAEVGASSGSVILFKPDTTEAQVVAARSSRQESTPLDRPRVSRTILSRILEGEDSVLVEDALADMRLMREKSVQELNLRSVLAIPLRFHDYLAGAIYLENARSAGVFREEDRGLLLEAGRLIAIYLNAAYRLREEAKARRRIYDEIKGKTHFDGIVGTSPRLVELLETVGQVGPTGATVIIEGESGTGKELIARAIHRSSKRAEKLMVVVNCAAIPENLLESELFGYEKGAFTGAVDRKIGRFEEANGTTLFLDEIAEMSFPLQAKLLRFLQDRELQRLGATRSIPIDVRLIAATNRDIAAMVKRGEFRDDLFFRLYVVPIQIPPLRQRLEDIPLLIDHFSRVFALQSGREPPQIDAEVYDCLQQYHWPGNIRELENLIQRLVVLSRENHVRVEDLPEHVRPRDKAVLEIQKNPFRPLLVPTPASYQEFKYRRSQMHELATTYAQKLEDEFIDTILERAGGNISRAAEQTGMHRTIIHRNLKGRKPFSRS